jgi:hypothetical protein
MLSKEDVEVNLHALQTMTEQFQVCECGPCLGILHRRSETASRLWVGPDYPTCPRTPLQYFSHKG